MANNPKIQAEAEINLKGAQKAVDLGEKLLRKIKEAKQDQKDMYDTPLVNIKEADIRKLRTVQNELEKINRTMEDLRRKGGLQISEGGAAVAGVGDKDAVTQYGKLRKSQQESQATLQELGSLGLSEQEFRGQQRRGVAEDIIGMALSRAGMGNLAGMAGMAAPVAAVAGVGMAGRYAYQRLTRDIGYGSEYAMSSALAAQRTGGNWATEWLTGIKTPERHLRAGVSYMDYMKLRGQMAGQRLEGATDVALDYSRLTGMADPSEAVSFAMNLDRTYAGNLGGIMGGIYRTAGSGNRMFGEWQRSMMGFAGGYQQRVGLRAPVSYLSEMGGIYKGFEDQFGKEGLYQAQGILGQMASAGQASGGPQEGFLLRAFMAQGGNNKSLLEFEKWKENAGKDYYGAILGQAKSEVGSEYAGYYLKKGGFIKSVTQYEKLLAQGLPMGDMITGTAGGLVSESGDMIPGITGLENIRKSSKELSMIGESATEMAEGLAKARKELAKVNAALGKFGTSYVAGDVHAELVSKGKPSVESYQSKMRRLNEQAAFSESGLPDLNKFYGLVADFYEGKEMPQMIQKGKMQVGDEAMFSRDFMKLYESYLKNPRVPVVGGEGKEIKLSFDGLAESMLRGYIENIESQKMQIIESKTSGVE